MAVVAVLLAGAAPPSSAQPSTTTEPPTSTSTSPPTTTTTEPPATTTTTPPPPTTTITTTNTPAAPPVPTSTELAKYQELSQAAARASEDVLTAQLDLTGKKAALDKANAAAAQSRQTATDAAGAETRATEAATQARTTATQLQDEVDHLVEISFKGLRLNGLAAVFSSDSPEEFLDASMIMDVYAERHGEMVKAAAKAAEDAAKAQQQAKDARTQVEATNRKAEDDRAAAQRLTDESTAAASQADQRKQDLDGKVAEVKQALAVLGAADLARLTGTGPTTNFTLPAGAAGDAVRFALGEVGKPYVWGAIGPDSYDCSGLVMAAYRSVGVQLPRTTYTQALVGTPVPRDQVKTGDLVLYYDTVSHVALAIDGTMAVHASTAGDPVKVSPIDAIGPIATIRRVGS
jgi:cell wall-associated NlpC family hydrolase